MSLKVFLQKIGIKSQQIKRERPTLNVGSTVQQSRGPDGIKTGPKVIKV
jgi:hypothetical protein